ncbi:MAG: AAA family ATPase [Actinobacteria bacterium]|nr:AAA family ATPase [Actinomycetota bacterium]
MAGVWPLTGRAEELRFINATMRRRDGSRGVVLAGAPGVGKTRLAWEALAGAGRSGSTIRWAAATASARALPLGAFSALIRSVGNDPTQTLRGAMEVLLDVSTGSDVAVGVDDAHLLDELSALLVHQLVFDGVATVVVTVRTGERSPDAVTALWKDGHLDRLEVQALSEPETGLLLEGVLGGPVESSSASRVWSLTRGNALFLRHLVDAEVEAGRLRSVGGVWRWSGASAMSPRLTELVEARMGGMAETVREVVDVLAVGEPLGLGLLGRLVDASAVEQAETAGLATVEREGRRIQVRLAHPLYGEVRRAVIGQLRARRLRGRIATALADAGGRRAGDTLRRAVLALDSDAEPESDLLTAAARSAVQLMDLTLAERLARAAIAAGGGFEARLTLAYALGWRDRGVEASVELTEVAEVARSDAERVAAAIAQTGNLFWTLSRPADAENVLAAAEATVRDPEARSGLAAMRAAFQAFRGRPDLALRTAREALGSERLPDPSVVLATWGLVLGLGLVGRADEIATAAVRGYEASTRTFEGGVLRFGQSHLQVMMLRLAGYLDDVDAIARDRRAEGVAVPGPMPLASATMLGLAALARGRLRSAVRWLQEGRHSNLPGWEFCCLVHVTVALAMVGDRTAAVRALAELEARRHPAFGFLEPEVVLARAWVTACQGMVSVAVDLAREAGRVAAGQGQPAHEVLALHTAVCFGDRTAADRLGELAGQVDGPRASIAARHAVALTEDSGDALHQVSVRFERMGDLVAAADAAAQASTAHGRHGAPAPARAAAARAHQLAEACEGASTPAIVAAVEPLPLTTREREIVNLAAAGLTNRDIADRLVVSVRTVEGHLYRASAKLGAKSRAELGALLSRG